jgi:signal transduction histidine kinase
VDVQRAIDDVLALLSEEAKVRNVDVLVIVQPEHLTVMAHDAELRQVVVNLIQNAMNAMPKGGCIHIQAHSGNAGHATIRISDTGMGISQDNLPRIFLPFFSRRVDGSRGMGLGLAICKVIVERFGGSIEANNQTEGGAVFTLTLPLAMPEESS